MTFNHQFSFRDSKFELTPCAIHRLCMALFVLAICELPAFAQPAGEAPPATPPALNINTLEFRLKASDSWDVRSQVLALVTKVLADEGSLVTQGTPLVQLDDERARLEYDAAEARYRRAWLYYRQTAATGNETTTEIARAEKDAAGQLLRVAKSYLDNHVIKAPLTGYLTEIHAPVGSVTKVGNNVLTLTVEEKLHLDVPLSRSKVSLNSTVAIKIGTQLYDAKVIALNPPNPEHQRLKTIVEDVATATLEVPNRKHQLRRGDTALVPQYPYLMIPRQAVLISPEGQTSIYVIRKGVPVALPLDVNATAEGGLLVAAAPLQDGDAILAAPAPGAQISPDPIAGTVVFPPTETALDVAALKEQMPEFSRSLQQYIEAVTDENKDTLIPDIEVSFPAEFQGILQNADYPLSEMKLDELYEALNLTPDGIIAFEELKEEFQRRVDEQGLKVKSLEDLKEIKGVEEYMQFVKSMRALNHDFANQLISELDDEQAKQLEQSFNNFFGLANLSDPETLSSLNLTDEQKSKLDAATSEIDGERFKAIQDLMKNAITSKEARDRIFNLIDSKSKNDLSFLPDNLLASMLQTESKASQSVSGNSTSNGNTSTTSENGKPKKPTETAEQKAKREAKEKDAARKRMLANLRKQTPPESVATGEEVDYGFYALVGGAILILLISVAYFTGVFSRTESDPKKVTKKNTPRRNRRDVSEEDEDTTTVVDELEDDKEN